MKRCYHCFRSIEDDALFCPYCGGEAITKPKEPIHLAPGTVLAGRYIIGAFVGAGGFGIVYKAWDTKLEIVVAVKEFFTSQIMTRAEGVQSVIINKKKQDEYMFRKERFLAEARNMAKFGTHRNIPNVYEFFEANNTAYIVMELLVGMPLNRYLEQCGGRIDPDFALYITNEVGNALMALHKEGIIHRDVAPDNIFICSGKDIVIKLMDFGAAKLADETDKVIDIILKPGYSPAEQYDKINRIGTWSDVYALGATLYLLLTGEKPEESTNRKAALENHLPDPVVPLNAINPMISENISNTVLRALSVEIQWRLKSVSEFLNALNGGIQVRSIEQEKKHKKYRRISGIAVSLIMLIVGGLIVFGIFQKRKQDSDLERATITVWYIDRGDAAKEEALQEIFDDFQEKFENVRIKPRAIPEADYVKEIKAALDEGKLPNLFESTGLPGYILEEASSVKNVLKSDQAEECLFLDQYEDYYEDYTRIPLAIEVPVAYVIELGPVSTHIDGDYFLVLSDFEDETVIAVDKRYSDLLKRSFSLSGHPDQSTFFGDSPTSPVLLSSSMAINEVRELSYTISTVYYDGEEIPCRFVYEWSIGNGSESKTKAAERLLSWMLGNVYQQKLLISTGGGKQIPEIPVNKECFKKKAEMLKYLNPILEQYRNYEFREE